MLNSIIQALKPHMLTRVVKAGEIITPDLGKSSCLYYVASGAAIVECTNLQIEKERNIGVMKQADQFIGLEFIFIAHPDTNHRLVVTAIQDSEIWYIHQPKLKTVLDNELYDQRSNLIELMTRQLAAAYNDLQLNLEEIATHAPHEQVLSALRRAAKKIGIHHDRGINVPVKISTLALLTGMSDESTRRATSKLMNEGLIAKAGRGFLLFN
jgi:CRP-like cAMP-binding protein